MSQQLAGAQVEAAAGGCAVDLGRRAREQLLLADAERALKLPDEDLLARPRVEGESGGGGATARDGEREGWRLRPLPTVVTADPDAAPHA
ncbi:hypothetical protein [Oryza sativa Japonica Group]|uniref:Uncharacterized protein n=1 Tax=Oryza sativa subsp. japonica TaxID=39947 RepID=Q5JK55_ORYSJ|nr:hypothetical protein [Oryza sativa Japonica Group]